EFKRIEGASKPVRGRRIWRADQPGGCPFHALLHPERLLRHGIRQQGNHRHAQYAPSQSHSVDLTFAHYLARRWSRHIAVREEQFSRDATRRALRGLSSPTIPA